MRGVCCLRPSDHLPDLVEEVGGELDLPAVGSAGGSEVGANLFDAGDAEKCPQGAAILNEDTVAAVAGGPDFGGAGES